MAKSLGRVFSEGFRVFFLGAGLYAVFTGLVWTMWLGVHATGGMAGDLHLGVPPHQWHAHEMIFGYGSAALGGFLLTAVPNWVGGPGVRRGFLLVAAGLWLAGRLAIWYSGLLPSGLVAVVDLAFLPVLGLKILVQLLKRPKPQNMMFLIFLGLFWISNLMVHLEWTGMTVDTLDTGLRGGLLVLCCLISVLGGRITPAFTRNAMKRDGVDEARWPSTPRILTPLGLVLAILLPVAVLLPVPDGIPAGLALSLALVQVVRLAGWRIGWAARHPILIALHAGLAMLALGLGLWGLALLGDGSEVAGLHILGIGCVGGMTLAVMSRASLGHSGRPLVAPGPVATAYALVPLAALARWLGSALAGDWYFPMVLASGALWVLAFTLFLASLWQALTGPRIEDQAISAAP